MVNSRTKRRIRLENDDITRLQVDAIVKAADATLLGGGGVDGAVHRAAGPELLAEYRRLGGCLPGGARLTRGHRLPAGHVIPHRRPNLAGRSGGEQQILEACYRSSLAIASAQRFREIAFPAIATGIYGYPRDAAARVAVATICVHLIERQWPELIAFVCFDTATRDAYLEALG